MLTSVTQPVSSSKSITVGYGYDLDGNQTAVTDGNGNTTYTTYNSLGLPQTITEPSTGVHHRGELHHHRHLRRRRGPGHPGPARRGAGQQHLRLDGRPDRPVRHRRSRADRDQDLHLRHRGAADDRCHQRRRDLGPPGYQPATSETFGYDDRGLLLSASGSAGTSAFTYNASAQLASATDAAGTSTYTYNSAGRLATDADAASGTTGTYCYNNLDQVTGSPTGPGTTRRASATTACTG